MSCSGGSSIDSLGPIAAIGVDEIQYAKGHKYLTLVYQIEQQCTRLLWIGRERTVASFEQFFALIGERIGRTDRVCLLGHVAALSDGDPRAVQPCHPHPRSLPHCRQDERRPGPGACRRGPPAGAATATSRC